MDTSGILTNKNAKVTYLVATLDKYNELKIKTNRKFMFLESIMTKVKTHIIRFVFKCSFICNLNWLIQKS